MLILGLASMGAAVVLAVGGSGAIARNQRWAEAAAAQAEAGLEVAKAVLASHARDNDGSLDSALPPPRSDVGVSSGAAWGAARPADNGACSDPGRPGCRDYERFVDQRTPRGAARIYIGRVLRDPGGNALIHDPRAADAAWSPDLDGDGEPDLAGVTVWVRRPLLGASDAPDGDRVVVTAEGRHPAPAGPDDPHAVVRLEMALRVAPRPPADEEEDEPGYSDGLKDWGRGRGGGGP